MAIENEVLVIATLRNFVRDWVRGRKVEGRIVHALDLARRDAGCICRRVVGRIDPCNVFEDGFLARHRQVEIRMVGQVDHSGAVCGCAVLYRECRVMVVPDQREDHSNRETARESHIAIG